MLTNERLIECLKDANLRIAELESRLKEIEKGNAGALALLGRAESDYFGSPQPQQFALEIKQLTDRLKESAEDGVSDARNLVDEIRQLRAQLTAAQSQLAAKDLQLAEAREALRDVAFYVPTCTKLGTMRVVDVEAVFQLKGVAGAALARLTPEAGEELAQIQSAVVGCWDVAKKEMQYGALAVLSEAIRRLAALVRKEK